MTPSRFVALTLGGLYLGCKAFEKRTSGLCAIQRSSQKTEVHFNVSANGYGFAALRSRSEPPRPNGLGSFLVQPEAEAFQKTKVTRTPVHADNECQHEGTLVPNFPCSLTIRWLRPFERSGRKDAFSYSVHSLAARPVLTKLVRHSPGDFPNPIGANRGGPFLQRLGCRAQYSSAAAVFACKFPWALSRIVSADRYCPSASSSSPMSSNIVPRLIKTSATEGWFSPCALTRTPRAWR